MTEAQEAQLLNSIHANQTQIIIPYLVVIKSELDAIKAKLTPPETGRFNPPPDLVKVAKLEVSMSVLQLEVGQTAVGKMTFDEPSPPADGAVMSDNDAVATISLDADKITWHCVGVAVGTANITYTGTSESPDVGVAVVPPMVVTIVAVPVAEHGDFDPTHAVITGP